MYRVARLGARHFVIQTADGSLYYGTWRPERPWQTECKRVAMRKCSALNRKAAKCR